MGGEGEGRGFAFGWGGGVCFALGLGRRAPSALSSIAACSQSHSSNPDPKLPPALSVLRPWHHLFNAPKTSTLKQMLREHAAERP